MRGSWRRSRSGGRLVAKYRKLPVIVEAEQWWPGKEIDGVLDPQRQDLPSIAFDVAEEKKVNLYRGYGWVETLEGGLIVSPGDYIITGVNGEKYPCKPDIFEQTYEVVNG